MGKLILQSVVALLIPPTTMAFMALMFTFDIGIVRASFLSTEMWLLGGAIGAVLFFINVLKQEL